MLSILASYAQEESLSASENQKWRIRKDFEKGKVSSLQMLGYKRNHNGVLEIIPDEARIVRLIFNSYLSGMGKLAVANMLNEMHISTKFDNEWTAEAVRRILTNEKYCGELMLQKFYSENHLTKRKMVNHGEIKKFYVEEAHPPIIEKSVFLAVQNLMKKHQRLSLIRLQAKSSANAAAKIIAEKQRQRALSGSVLHTTQRVKNTVLKQSKFQKIR